MCGSNMVGAGRFKTLLMFVFVAHFLLERSGGIMACGSGVPVFLAILWFFISVVEVWGPRPRVFVFNLASKPRGWRGIPVGLISVKSAGAFTDDEVSLVSAALQNSTQAPVHGLWGPWAPTMQAHTTPQFLRTASPSPGSTCLVKRAPTPPAPIIHHVSCMCLGLELRPSLMGPGVDGVSSLGRPHKSRLNRLKPRMSEVEEDLNEWVWEKKRQALFVYMSSPVLRYAYAAAFPPRIYQLCDPEFTQSPHLSFPSPRALKHTPAPHPLQVWLLGPAPGTEFVVAEVEDFEDPVEVWLGSLALVPEEVPEIKTGVFLASLSAVGSDSDGSEYDSLDDDTPSESDDEGVLLAVGEVTELSFSLTQVGFGAIAGSSDESTFLDASPGGVLSDESYCTDDVLEERVCLSTQASEAGLLDEPLAELRGDPEVWSGGEESVSGEDGDWYDYESTREGARVMLNPLSLVTFRGGG